MIRHLKNKSFTFKVHPIAFNMHNAHKSNYVSTNRIHCPIEYKDKKKKSHKQYYLFKTNYTVYNNI